MIKFNQFDLEAFIAKAAWARNQATASSSEHIRNEYMTLAICYEGLVEDLQRLGYGDTASSIH